jgi:hypothetical protein
MRDFRDAKLMAHALRDALRSRAVETTHSESLELIAKAFGFDNWNILAAKIEAAAPPAAAAGGPTPPRVLHCSFCGKSQHDVRKLIAGPAVYICDECAELCIDIVREESPLWKVMNLLSAADQKSEGDAYQAALAHVRGRSSEEVAAYVEAAKSAAEKHRVIVDHISRKLALRDGEEPAEGDILGTPRFAYLRDKTRTELLTVQQDTRRALKRSEDALRIGTTVLDERQQ